MFDDAGQLINDGLAAELVQRLTASDRSVKPRRMGRTWVLSVCPNVYRDVVERWICSESRITVRHGAKVRHVVQADRKVVQIDVDGPQGGTSLTPATLVDTTGTAEDVRLIDSSLLADDHYRAAGGWIFRLGVVPPGVLDFPNGV